MPLHRFLKKISFYNKHEHHDANGEEGGHREQLRRATVPTLHDSANTGDSVGTASEPAVHQLKIIDIKPTTHNTSSATPLVITEQKAGGEDILPMPYQQDLSPSTEPHLTTAQNGMKFGPSLAPPSPGATSVTSDLNYRPLSAREVAYIKEGPHSSRRKEKIDKAGASFLIAWCSRTDFGIS
jgi:hypothetical protein